jgi:hypothetical protein
MIRNVLDNKKNILKYTAKAGLIGGAGYSLNNIRSNGKFVLPEKIQNHIDDISGKTKNELDRANESIAINNAHNVNMKNLPKINNNVAVKNTHDINIRNSSEINNDNSKIVGKLNGKDSTDRSIDEHLNDYSNKSNIVNPMNSLITRGIKIINNDR